MRKLVIAFIGIGSLVALLLVLALFFPRDISVKETITIDASSKTVHENVNDLENWLEWMPWLEQDSTIEISFNEITKGIGGGYSWKNSNGDSGSLKIIESTAQEIVTEVSFGEMNSTIGRWKFESSAEGTLVYWQMDFTLSYPTTIMGSMIKEAMRPDLQKGLQNLKRVSEGDGEN